MSEEAAKTALLFENDEVIGVIDYRVSARNLFDVDRSFRVLGERFDDVVGKDEL